MQNAVVTKQKKTPTFTTTPEICQLCEEADPGYGPGEEYCESCATSHYELTTDAYFEFQEQFIYEGLDHITTLRCCRD